MKIKVGGYYQTKDNRRAFVEGLDKNETQQFFIGFIEGVTMFIVWTQEGKCVSVGHSEYDLVEELSEITSNERSYYEYKFGSI